MAKVRKVLLAVFLLLIVALSISGYLALYGQGALADVGLSSPNLLLQDVWSLPSYVTNATAPYLYAYYRWSGLSLLGPAVPVVSSFGTSNGFSLDVGQLDQAISDLLQHSGPLNSADQAHAQNLASASIIPFIQQDSPVAMVSSVWSKLYGSTSAVGQLTVNGKTYASYSSFLNAIEQSTALAQQISVKYGWGWTQTCTTNESCPAGEHVFVPAGRYWTPTTLGLVFQFYARQGLSQSSSVGNLETLGYTPSLVNLALAKANSMGGTRWALVPAGTALSVLPNSPAIPGGVDYGTHPYTVSPGLPEPAFVVDQHGNIIYAVGAVGFGPPSPSDLNTWIRNGCGSGATCSPVESFWATVETNGGWGAVQGGYVPSLEIPTSFVQGFGSYLESSGFKYPTTTPENAISGNPFADGATGVLAATTGIMNGLYNGYPVTTDVPGVNGVPQHPTPGTTCQTGCISPVAFDNSIAALNAFQQYAKLYHQQTGNYLMFGQPPLEQGLQPGYGAGSALPTPPDAFTTGLLNGAYSSDVLAAYNPRSPLAAQAHCSDANSCNAYLNHVMYQAYLDPSNPGSVTTWFGGGGSSGFGSSVACGGSGCGWAEGIPSYMLDPHCSDAICSNAAQSNFGVNCQGADCTTHYVISNMYQMFNQAMQDPGLAAQFKAAGINSAYDYAMKEAQINEELSTGKLTALDAPAVATMADLIGAAAANYQAGIKEMNAVFGLPFGGTPTGGYHSGTSAPPADYQQWYERCQVGLCSVGIGDSYVSTTNVFKALTNIRVGLITLGQYLSQHGTSSGSAWGLVSDAVRYALGKCAGQCSLTQYDGYVADYLQSKGINTTPDKNSNARPDPPSPSKSTAGGPTGAGAGGYSGPIKPGTSVCVSLLTTFCVMASGVSSGRGTAPPAGGLPSGLENPNSVSYWRLGLLNVVSLGFLSPSSSPQPGILIGSLFISFLELGLLIVTIILGIALFLSRKRK